MDSLSFEEVDSYLMTHKGRIIHQIWFGFIPTKRQAANDFEKMKKYRNSWVINNPGWVYKCWNYSDCAKLVKYHFGEHLEMYNSYEYHIQKCDCVRYLLLYRYGGIYADVDYCCVKPWDNVIDKYKADVYLVETPNKINKNNVHVSNSLMYSKPNNPFWKSVFVEMQKSSHVPVYYSRHLAVMFTTGPGMLNRVYQKYKELYKVGYYPFKLFHPFGIIKDDKVATKISSYYAYHVGNGSWESSDSKILLFLYTDYLIVLFIMCILGGNLFIKQTRKVITN